MFRCYTGKYPYLSALSSLQLSANSGTQHQRQISFLCSTQMTWKVARAARTSGHSGAESLPCHIKLTWCKYVHCTHVAIQRWGRLSELPRNGESPLGLEAENLPGINTTMLYVGVLFAHFCWHYEDNALYRSFLANLQIRVALHREFPVRGLRNLCSLSGCFEHNDSQWSISSKCID
jgi:hypothetical protein